MLEIKILHRDFPQEKDNIDYIWITLLWFHFRWFLDCGEWFVYFEWWTKKKVYGYRFSSAGCMGTSHERSYYNKTLTTKH